MAKIPNEVTLTLHQAKFLEKTSGNSNGVNTWLYSCQDEIGLNPWRLPYKLHARRFPSHTAHHEMCTWIQQQDHN